MTEHTSSAHWVRYACDGCGREIPLLVPSNLVDRPLHSYPCYTCGSYTSHRRIDTTPKTGDTDTGANNGV